MHVHNVREQSSSTYMSSDIAEDTAVAAAIAPVQLQAASAHQFDTSRIVCVTPREWGECNRRVLLLPLLPCSAKRLFNLRCSKQRTNTPMALLARLTVRHALADAPEHVSCGYNVPQRAVQRPRHSLPRIRARRRRSMCVRFAARFGFQDKPTLCTPSQATVQSSRKRHGIVGPPADAVRAASAAAAATAVGAAKGVRRRHPEAVGC